MLIYNIINVNVAVLIGHNIDYLWKNYLSSWIFFYFRLMPGPPSKKWKGVGEDEEKDDSFDEDDEVLDGPSERFCTLIISLPNIIFHL